MSRSKAARGLKSSGMLVLCWTLIVQIALPTSFQNHVYARNDADMAAGSASRAVPKNILREAINEAMADPLLEWVKKNDAIPTDAFIANDDPSLDQDPFFLRAQEWTAAGGKLPLVASAPGVQDAPAFQSDANGITIRIPGTTRAWRLKAPVHPVVFTDEYVVLALNEGSNLFARASEGLEDEGQGVFVVSYPELLASAGAQEPTPVYFLPLPGTGWAGNVRGIEFARQNTVVLADTGGESIPVEFDDLETVVKAERMNLMMAMSAGVRATSAKLRKDPAFRRDLSRLNGALTAGHLDSYLEVATTLVKGTASGKIHPPRGSTAGFGTLFTGIDLDNPENSVFAGAPRGISKFGETLWAYFSSTSAHADESSDAILAKEREKLKQRLTRVFMVVGLAFILSVALKYTLYKERFAKRAEKETAGDVEKGKNQTVIRKVFRETRDAVDVYAHLLTTIGQFAIVTSGNLIEFMADSKAPRLAAADNKLLRKLIKGTVGWYRDSNSQTPVNAKTWLFGTPVLGGIDTYFVYVQLYDVVPEIGAFIGENVPILKSRSDEAFGIGNPLISETNQYEVARNASAYLSVGASSFSADLQSQYLVSASKEVEEEMRNEQKDPNDAKNKEERDRRIRAKQEVAFRNAGLPGPEDFLFDANTLNSLTYRLLGYDVSEPAPGVTYRGAQRPGLILPSVKRALEVARETARTRPWDENVAGTVRLFEGLNNDLSVLDKFVRAPKLALGAAFTSGLTLEQRVKAACTVMLEHVKRFRQARQELMRLTHEGPVDAIHGVAETWKTSHGEVPAALAADLFRRAYMGFMSDDPTLMGPTDELREKHGKRAAALALEEMVQRHVGDLVNFDRPAETGDTEALIKRYPDEYAMIFDEKVVDVARGLRELEKPEVFKPVKKGLVTRWQERKAVRRADEQFLAESGAPFSAISADPASTERWQRLYSEALVNTWGLFPDYSDNDELKAMVENKAQQMVRQQLADPAVQAYLQSLEPAERAQGLGAIYAAATVNQYLSATAGSDRISPLSPAQPGRLQRLRQTAYRNSRVMTRACRLTEAFLSHTAVRPGLGAMLERNLPGWADVKLAHVRVARQALTRATAVYQFDKYFWGNALNPAMWSWSLMWRFAIFAPSQILNKALAGQGIKTMGSIAGIIIFSLVYTWATFWGSIPQYIFAGDYQKAWDTVMAPLNRGASAAGGAVSNTWDRFARWILTLQNPGADEALDSATPVTR